MASEYQNKDGIPTQPWLGNDQTLTSDQKALERFGVNG